MGAWTPRSHYINTESNQVRFLIGIIIEACRPPAFINPSLLCIRSYPHGRATHVDYGVRHGPHASRSRQGCAGEVVPVTCAHRGILEASHVGETRRINNSTFGHTINIFNRCQRSMVTYILLRSDVNLPVFVYSDDQQRFARQRPGGPRGEGRASGAWSELNATDITFTRTPL